MQFKKMTNEDIKYSSDETIIGPRFIKASDATTASTYVSSVDGINVFKEKDGKRIPIKLEENQFFEVDLFGSVQNRRIENWLTITNPSPSDKIWNVGIDIPKYSVHEQIGEIEANQGWKQEISVGGVEPELPISIAEVISRNGYAKNADVPSDLFLDKAGTNFLYISIFVINNSNNTLKEFDLLKRLPATVENIVKVEGGSGKIESDRKGIRWLMKVIRPYEKVALNFQLKIAPVPTIFGDISAVFFFSDVENENIIKKFKASAKIAQFIEISEQDDNPNVWNCSLRVINRSLFLVDVLAAKLFQKRENEEKMVIESSNAVSLKPCEEKVLITSVISDISRPSMSNQLEIIPEFIFENVKSCSLSLSAKRMEILNVSAKKTFDVDEIESYKESLFSCTIETQNFSSIPLNHLFFEELIPEYFEPGDIADVELRVADQTIKIRDWNPSSSEDQVKSMDLINSEIADLDAKIKEILHTSTNIGNLDTESLSQQIETVHKDLRSSIEEQEKQGYIVKELKSKLDSLKTTLAERNEQLRKKNDLKAEIASLSKEFNEQSEVLKTIQNQRARIEKEAKESDVGAKKVTEGETIGGEEPKDSRLSLIKTHEAQIQEKISNIRKQIDEKDEKIKEIAKDIIESNISRSNNDDISDLEKESVVLANSLEKANDLLKNTTSRVASFKESYDSYNNLKNRMDLVTRRDALHVQKQRIELLQSGKPDFIKVRDCLIADFQNGAKDPIRKQFDVVPVMDEFNNTHLFITILNLDSVASAINSQEKLSISYYIRAIKPHHDIEYKFGSIIHYMTDAAQGMQKYSISKETLPKLRIIHERHKMMVGKLIDKQSNENKYFVTLLVKNSGGKPLKNIKIVEVFPGEIEILNAYNQYEEHVLENGNKQIIWFLDQVNSFQECEIGYVVDLHGKEYDLNDSQLCFI